MTAHSPLPTGGFACERWQLEVAPGEPCAGCLAHFDERPDPRSMTGEQRAAELDALVHPLLVWPELAQQRIEALVGRPVFSHELGLGWPALLDEARAERVDESRPLPIEQLIAALIAAGKPVIIVSPDDQEPG